MSLSPKSSSKAQSKKSSRSPPPIPTINVVGASPETPRKSGAGSKISKNHSMGPPPPPGPGPLATAAKVNKKVAVTHGHSMANWMTRIQNEGPRQVSNRIISKVELAEHSTREDCWMALRGKVFDVTDYVDYHPGGAAYIKKGSGVDATKMFNNVHNYVNFESILKGRQVGRYIPEVDEKPAKGGGGGCCKLCNGSSIKDERIPITAFDEDSSTVQYKVECALPNVEVNYWSMGITNKQTLSVKLVTKPPEVWIANLKLTEKLTDDMLRFSFENQFKKMILTLQKPTPSKWKTIGTPLQNHNTLMDSKKAPHDYYPAKIVAKDEVGPSHFLYAINMGPEVHFGIPVAWILFLKINGVSKPYTPVKFLTNKQMSAYESLESDNSGQVLYFLIKNFKNGALTGPLDRIPLGEVGHLEVGGICGSFDTDELVNIDRLILIGGGTGIAPFVSIIKHIKEKRREINVKQVILFQSAKASNDIMWKETWDKLAKDDWFYYFPYVTCPSDDWTGNKNRCEPGSIQSNLTEVPPPGDSEVPTNNMNVHAMGCGPRGFTDTCDSIFKVLGIPEAKIRMFPG